MDVSATQLGLFPNEELQIDYAGSNKLQSTDRAFHDWYRFVLSFPPHLVRHYFDKFSLTSGNTVLDPFCGTGTTIVEAKKNAMIGIGIEASPLAALASRVKTTWRVDPHQLIECADDVVKSAKKSLSNKNNQYLHLLPAQQSLLLKDSICELPLHKCLLLIREIDEVLNEEIKNTLLLALAHVAVHSASNLKFGPEVGVRKKKKQDAPVLEDFQLKVSVMAEDLKTFSNFSHLTTQVFQADARKLRERLDKESIDGIITSPPYPNEKDYTRTTRLESVLLGLISDKKGLRQIKHSLIRSNTRNVYVQDSDDVSIRSGSNVDRISKEIERRRIALNKTSGFERMYHRVTRLYFGGMKQHFLNLRPYLKPGAKLAYVVGDQASYLQVMIRTGELLAEIADEVGFDVLGMDLFRTRISTVTGEQLREEVLILEWNGMKKKNSNKTQHNRYDQLIEEVFFQNYKQGANEIDFDRDELEPIAKKLKFKLPKNLGDIVYSYRYRNKLPESITDLLDVGEEWIIRPIGKGKYRFAKSAIHRITPNPRLSNIKILDSTPEIIKRYALNDEQALLAILRYNRLVDTFLGITCYPLQSHLRTTIPDMGQVETDEIYIGVNKQGTQFVIPVQAKGKSDELGIVQIEQDFRICDTKFTSLLSRPIAAQFMADDLIAVFEFERIDGDVTIKDEKHYKIVPNEELTDNEITSYRET